MIPDIIQETHWREPNSLVDYYVPFIFRTEPVPIYIYDIFLEQALRRKNRINVVTTPKKDTYTFSNNSITYEVSFQEPGDS